MSIENSSLRELQALRNLERKTSGLTRNRDQRQFGSIEERLAGSCVYLLDLVRDLVKEIPME